MLPKSESHYHLIFRVIPGQRQIRDAEETKRSVSVKNVNRPHPNPNRLPGQRQIRDTEETKCSVSAESAFTRTLIGLTRTQTDSLANVRLETQKRPSIA